MCIKRPITIRSISKRHSLCEREWQANGGRCAIGSERKKIERIRLQPTMNLKWSEIELLIPCFDTFFTHCATAAHARVTAAHRKPIKLIDNQRSAFDYICPRKVFCFGLYENWKLWKMTRSETGERERKPRKVTTIWSTTLRVNDAVLLIKSISAWTVQLISDYCTLVYRAKKFELNDFQTEIFFCSLHFTK